MHDRLQPTFVRATTLPDAWFQVIEACVRDGRIYTITEGSYVGQQRKELDYLTVQVTHPHSLPLLPEMPPGMAKLNPVPEGMDYVERYLPYLMTNEKKPGEQYTYGERLFGKLLCGPPNPVTGLSTSLSCQVDEVIKKYKRGFGNNQCAMTIAIPNDVHLTDPPCLRHIDTRIFTDEQREGAPKLHFFVYFRSWDLYCGFPANMAVLEHLQCFMADMIGVEPGEILASTKGGHVYDMYWNIAQRRLGD